MGQVSIIEIEFVIETHVLGNSQRNHEHVTSYLFLNKTNKCIVAVNLKEGQELVTEKYALGKS